MAIEIDESLLLGLAALIFVPVFLFCIKMIMKVGTIESKLDNVHQHISSSQKDSVELNAAKTELRLLEARVKGIEKDVDYLLSIDRSRSGQNIAGQNRTIGYNNDRSDYNHQRSDYSRKSGREDGGNE